MQIYHYDQETGEYIVNGVADADPLVPGNWLIPAHATHIPPIASIEGQSVFFRNGEWVHDDPTPEPEWLPKASNPDLPPPDESLIEQVPYSVNRIREYPSIGDQLDALFHAGVFPPEMAAQIQAVKDRYPKS
jgi:hypothetical protein